MLLRCNDRRISEEIKFLSDKNRVRYLQSIEARQHRGEQTDRMLRSDRLVIATVKSFGEAMADGDQEANYVTSGILYSLLTEQDPKRSWKTIERRK